MKVNIDEFIAEIEKGLNIQLLYYEREYLKSILKAKLDYKEIILKRARGNGHCLTRADAILASLDNLTKDIEKNILKTNNLDKPKGIMEELK